MSERPGSGSEFMSTVSPGVSAGTTRPGSGSESMSTVSITIDGRRVDAPEGATLLSVAREQGVEVPTLCQLDTLTPVNTCRLCVMELEGSRTLVPSCSRSVEEGMVVHTASERVRHSRRMVLELLASSVDLDRAGPELTGWMEEYGADPARMSGERVVEEPRIHDELYVRDYSRCILCYKCVEVCGTEAQHSFAITVAGRGYGARISTEYDVDLTESACVYCGNCIGVCPTGALVFRTEWDHREAGTWSPETQEVTRTVCSYCGIGCNLELHTQDGEIVKVTSPLDHDVTRGNLCIKGRFGYDYLRP